jgi:hypothetical protein
MQFTAYGHANIEGTHKTTFELTQHTAVTPKGDCIIGTRAGFDPAALAALAQVSKKLKMTLKARNYTEVIVGDSNPQFAPGAEVVVRKTDFVSSRTLMLNADKAAADFARPFVALLKNPEEHLDVTVERLQ